VISLENPISTGDNPEPCKGNIMANDTQPRVQSRYSALTQSPRFLEAQKNLLAAIAEESLKLRQVRSVGDSDVRRQFADSISTFNRNRGREVYYPYLSSGLGAGPYIELTDGSVKLDMITGIGINFFGHSHPALMEEVLLAASADIMQGNLQPGVEAKDVLQAILARVGTDKGSRLKHAWLTCSGTMANEIALKIIRQKKSPSTKVIAFEDCFAGRSTAMQEITDNAGYRQGQPLYGEAYHLPYYSPKMGLARSLEIAGGHLKWLTDRFPGKIAALMIELVQGEGGFNYAPREFYVKIFEQAKAAGLAIWVDEIQTFGRTGELFAYQTFGLHEWVDVVTVGKMLQACMVLYTEEYNPKPGLVAGTFSGSTVALRTAKRVLELLDEEKHLGSEGRTNQLSRRFRSNIESLSKGACSGMIGEIRTIGGMIAFEPFGGTMDDVKKVLMKLFDLGVVAFYCGHGPYLIRMLPPLGAMSEVDVDETCRLIGAALVAVNESRQAQSGANA
jgi:4-aminobutyrate aminotransferase-like enzyme